MSTTGTQALNLKNSDWNFQVLPFWLEKSSLKWISFPLSFDILLGIFLMMFQLHAWATVLSNGFSPALLKTAEKHRDTVPLDIDVRGIELFNDHH